MKSVEVSELSLDRELIRDLTPEEMNGANGGVEGHQPQPMTTTGCLAASSEPCGHAAAAIAVLDHPAGGTPRR